MNKIVQCVPNYSIGNEKVKLAEITSPFKNNPLIRLVSVESDDDYNRSVVTIIGEVNAVVEAMVKSVVIASGLIDLRKHTGAHPRMGAVDVIPIIPLKNISIDEAVAYSDFLGCQIAKETKIPVFMYEHSAHRDNRRRLENIRRGEFEGMFNKTLTEEWFADYGVGCHESCGVSAVGVRDILVAYNITLATDDLFIANSIAKSIRYSNGGYRYLKAKGVYLNKRHEVQVTMNLTNYRKTQIYQAFEAVKMEARRFNVDIKTSEIVGLVPLEALKECAAYYLQVKDPKELSLSIEEVISIACSNLKLVDFNSDKLLDKHLEYFKD